MYKKMIYNMNSMFVYTYTRLHTDFVYAYQYKNFCLLVIHVYV